MPQEMYNCTGRCDRDRLFNREEN